METQGSIGLLPQELMQVIIHYTSMQAVSSIWMSGRFWHYKLANVLRHPKILMVDNTNKIVMIQNGKAYDMSKSRSVFYRMGSKPHQIVNLKYGWFDDISSLKSFLEEFNQALRNNSNIFNPNIRKPIFIKVKPIDSEPQYYTAEDSKHLNILDSTAYDRLCVLVKNLKIVDPEPRREARSNDEDPDGEKHCVEGISLNIFNRGEESMSLEMHMGTNGDINMKIYTANNVEVNVQLRTSYLIFQELEEIIVYSKHMQQLPALKGENELLSFKSIFDLKCMKNGKKYYIQEYALKDDPKKLITNSYKNGSVKKIIQLLEPLLFNKSIPSPLHEGLVTSAPPTFSGHQLIRMPRLKALDDEDLPSVLAIQVQVTHRQKYTLSLHNNVPLKEIVALFRRVEQNIDYKDTKPCTHAIQVPPDEKITEIKIYSRKSLEPITRLKTSVVLDVWNMLIRSRVVID